MKKIILAITVIIVGLGIAAFGLFSLKKADLRNSVLDSVTKAIPAESLERVKGLKDNSIPIRFLLGMVYLRLEDRDRAEEIWSQIIINPETSGFWRVRALYNLANLQVIKAFQNQDKSAFKNAIFYYQESLRLEPNFWPSKYNLERLIQENPQDQKGQKEKQEGEGEEGKDESKDKNKDSKPGLNPPNSNIP